MKRSPRPTNLLLLLLFFSALTFASAQLSPPKSRAVDDPNTCPVCPPCFNCKTSNNKCVNGGQCGDSGLCHCPVGWGGLDCVQPLCGSLASSDRKPRDGETCSCDSGWGGVNCNVCQSDSSCHSIKGENATCIKTAVGLKQMHAWCDTTNIPWIDDTHVSLQCEWEKSSCVFQFWKGSQEQFYCNMNECSQERSGDNDVHGSCAKSECGCISNAWLCGGEIDMSELLNNVRGPSEWYCRNGKDCWYNEYSKLKDFFPDNIDLNCDVGECANEQDFLDVNPIPHKFSRTIEAWIVGSIFIGAVIIWVGTNLVLRGQRKVFSAGGGIRLDDSDDEVYNEEESLFESTRGTATLVFSDMSYNVAGKPILTSVSGLVQPGEMLAIMGPSGAGKSSFLDILARKPKRGTVTGSVLINNAIPARRQFKKLAGYVDQEDVLMGTLTVRETLMYSALLRLPRSMPLRIKQRRVEDTMAELGISHIADTRVGIPGRRGISGGEKRRVSIGKELVTSPSILFLDEPTSGLDSYNAYVVMECLKKLARVHRRTVVVTIHQPRSNIYKMFDSLLLLAEGRTVYFGPAQLATNYFASIGYPIPSEYNIADYLIDLTMNKPSASTPPPADPETPPSSFTVPFLSRRSNSTTSIASTRALEDLPTTQPRPTSPTLSDPPVHPLTQAIEGMADLPDHHDELRLLTSSNHSHTLIEGYRNSDMAESVRAAIRNTVGGEPLNVPPSVASRFGSFGAGSDAALSLPAFLHEFSLLSSRTFTNLYRDPFLFLAHCVIALGLGILLGALFWQVDNDLPGVQNRLGVLFFMCALLGFASTSSLDLFAQERVLFMRERENGYYGPAAYFWSKVLFDIIPLRMIPPLLMGSVSYYMVGLNPNVIVFAKFMLVLVLFNLVAASVCLCFATAFKSVGAGNLLASLIMLFAMLFGGFLLNKEHIPIFLRWVQYLSFFNYGYEALIVNELKDMTLRDDSIVEIKIPGSVILARFGFNGQAYWQDVRALGIMFVGTMVMAFVFLKVLVRERR